MAACVLVSKGHITITNALSLNEKKQVIFIGLWLSISVFLNDLFRGFFLFSLIIAYICLCRIVYRTPPLTTKPLFCIKILSCADTGAARESS